MFHVLSWQGRLFISYCGVTERKTRWRFKMLPDKKRYEDMALTHFHSMAQLRSKLNVFIKVLEVEMKKIKEQLKFDE
jgi:hypothetical protein